MPPHRTKGPLHPWPHAVTWLDTGVSWLPRRGIEFSLIFFSKRSLTGSERVASISSPQFLFVVLASRGGLAGRTGQGRDDDGAALLRRAPAGPQDGSQCCGVTAAVSPGCRQGRALIPAAATLVAERGRVRGKTDEVIKR